METQQPSSKMDLLLSQNDDDSSRLSKDHLQQQVPTFCPQRKGMFSRIQPLVDDWRVGRPQQQ
jgi:hypothetical protein